MSSQSRKRGDGPAPRASGWSDELPLVGYAAGNFGKNLLLAGIDLTLLFMLTDLLGIAPRTVGALMVIVFIGDLVFDIAAGYFATWARRIGIGYRKIIVLGAIPCGLAFALVYSLPLLHIRDIKILGAILITFRATYAIIDVPHNSLLGRIATDSRARGRVSGYRLLFSSMASLLVALVLTPGVVGAARNASIEQMAIIGIASAAAACVGLWIAAWATERIRADAEPPRARSRIPLVPKLDGLIAAMALIGLATGFAAPMFGRMMIYLATYVYEQPYLASRLLLAITLGQFPGFLLWTFLVRHYEKTTLLAVSNAMAIASMVLIASAPPQPTLLLTLAILVGIAFSGAFMLPWGILADVIDFSQFRHRERREAATVATFLVVIKSGGAASAVVVGWVLAQLGYVAGTEQSATVILGIKVLAFGVPIAGSVVSIALLSRLSMGHAAHARILRILEARAGA